MVVYGSLNSLTSAHTIFFTPVHCQISCSFALYLSRRQNFIQCALVLYLKMMRFMTLGVACIISMTVVIIMSHLYLQLGHATYEIKITNE